MVGVHRHDVVPGGHRPIGAELALGREVDRILGPQALEDGPQGVILKALHLGRIELGQRRGIGLRGGLADLHSDVHGFTPFRTRQTARRPDSSQFALT